MEKTVYLIECKCTDGSIYYGPFATKDEATRYYKKHDFFNDSEIRCTVIHEYLESDFTND